MIRSHYRFTVEFIDVDGSTVNLKENVKVKLECLMHKKLRSAVKVLVEVYADERMADLDANSWRIK